MSFSPLISCLATETCHAYSKIHTKFNGPFLFSCQFLQWPGLWVNPKCFSACWGHFPFKTSVTATVLVYFLTLPGGRLFPFSWVRKQISGSGIWNDLLLLRLWSKSKNVTKWYTFVADSLLNGSRWYGSLYREMMIMSLKYRNKTTLMNPPILGFLALLAFSLRIKVISASWAIVVQNSSWKMWDFECIRINDFNSIHTQSIKIVPVCR